MSKTITSGQPFQTPQAVAVANGFLILTLSQAAEVTSGGGQVAPKVVSITLDGTGKIPGSTTILANDELTPSGTTYTAELLDSGGNIIANFGQWSIAGASPIDLSLQTPTTTGASYPAPVLQQPTASQVINGQPLVMQSAVLGFSTTATADTGISRTAASTLALGNGTASDKTGILQLTSIQGPGFKFQQFTSSGTFTIPTGITQVKVTVVGGGGAGGGGVTTANASGGGGGDSGSAAIKWLTGLTPGNTLTVTVGAGGTGVSGANGNNGVASSVASGTQTISTITGNGGPGGSVGSTSGATQTAVPTAGTGGDINLTGNSGTVAVQTTGFVTGGTGASLFFGGGGLPGTSNVVGAAAAANSGAGGGGGSSGGSNVAGGNGGSGIVIFEWVN